MLEQGRYNYYEILELPTTAPQHEVTTAYERAKATYSGENPAIYTIFSDHEARELLTLIEEAYAILGNKTLRGIYDQRLLGGQAQPKELSYQSILTASRALFPENKPEEKKNEYKIDEIFEKKISDCKEWDGEFLKKVREYKCIGLDRMSEKTKINSYYLNALEGMDPSGLPAPVFVRGYVIQVAKFLGLNDKTVADSYMKIFRARTEPQHARSK
ncbi:MAG: helix-turn-helix domain-containing protein [Bdellovibrionaceae bacterium]|nr:helix-turn-helix domain-containing protein [Pseudobdellovibrionaceae bacterium]MBX3033732.1 helix-turn-helix domain-containing protein [Pseudobdellovibrionaceae bacterium]